MNKDFKNRLGACNPNDIKKHPFFDGIDWENIKKEKPPFEPKEF